MQWEHDAIISGQWWRIVTGNFAHTNIYHLTMNLLGLWIICFIFRTHLKVKSFCCILLCLSTLIGISLLFTSIDIYVGLSGVLHGIFAYYALVEYRQGNKSSIWLVIGVVVKVLWEQVFGSQTGSEGLIGASVATSAHLCGVIGGLALGFFDINHLNKRTS